MVWPKASGREAIPPEVPDEFREDYREASLILRDSPKASAALGRRCLQHILRDKAGVQPGNLYDEIQEVIDGGTVPSVIANALHSVREIGNFSAHLTKSKNTGEIVDVDEGEAEWCLDVIASLFDFYFVLPETVKKRVNAVNVKLAEAGKREIDLEEFQVDK